MSPVAVNKKDTEVMYKKEIWTDTNTIQCWVRVGLEIARVPSTSKD